MNARITFQAASIASLVAFCCTLVMGFGVRPPDGAPGLQPTHPTGPVCEFVKPSNEYPDKVLIFFTADSLFVLSYTTAFVGLYTVVSARSRLLASIGLGAGLISALLDATENAFLITYALQARNGAPLTEPALPAIYVLANLKWMAGFCIFYAFGLIWPRENWLGWLLSALMLLFPLVGVLSIYWQALVNIRGVFLLLGMPLFAYDFWRRARITPNSSFQ
jgi:hypothetical protein